MINVYAETHALVYTSVYVRNVSNNKNLIKELMMASPKPTKPALWSRAKSEAKKKFKVYPSAYANAWASKWYKSKGGGWTGKDNRVKKS
ncbi:MAG: hypothetical protein CMJ25_01000 [Phycisphaerae bacterium]|nr:hypothetical protein [Phycisphaerae bacterium]